VRIIFSSDLHGLFPVFRLFAEALASGPNDVGVLAGDILDDLRLPDGFLIESLGIDPDDLLDDLPAEDDPCPWETMMGRQSELNAKGLLILEKRGIDILSRARKPVLIVPGNHDQTPWADSGPVLNIHGRRVELDGWNFVGYRGTISPMLSDEDIGAELVAIRPLVDSRTILVTHNPPRSVLDRCDRPNLGSESIRRLVSEREPAWHLFGHIHQAFGRKGNSVNGSYPLFRAFYDIDVDRRRVRRVAAATEITNPRWV
jgi:Icc-related predicted phosphoesterase